MRWHPVSGWDDDLQGVRTVMRLLPIRERSRRYSNQYVRVFAEGWKLLRTSRLTQSEATLFFLLMERAPGLAAWDASPAVLEKALRWDRPRISKTLTSLEDKGLITRTGARPGEVQHNPAVSWSSDVIDREVRMHAVRHPEFYDQETA